jgi:hypothetical protein
MPRFPLPQSSVIKGFRWLGERIARSDPNTHGDTYPMTWGQDDEIYTAAGDPLWGDKRDGLDFEKFSGSPTDYKITQLNPMKDYTGYGGNGPKPCGMIQVEGILYLAFQNMLRLKTPAYGTRSQHGSDAHIVYNRFYDGKPGDWIPALANVTQPMFAGSAFGGPAFVNFGKNNANARDKYVYAVSSDQWDNGSNLRLGRVPSDSIFRREAWEWVTALSATGEEPAWTRNLDQAVPILSLHRYIGLPDMVYLAGIKRYLLLTWRLHTDFSGNDGTDLLILDAPEPWGPFSLVHFEEYWEGKEITPYCPRLPLKWIERDGRTGWVQFSGSWEAPQKHYNSHVRKFELLMD